MTLQEAMSARHMVRKYEDRPLPPATLEQLQARIADNNSRHNLAIRLVTNDGGALPSLLKWTVAKGVTNYLIMAGTDAPDLGERLGYAGADIMLYAQTIGLNTWWASGTINFGHVGKLAEGLKVHGIVAVGFGQTQGVPHKSKTAGEVSTYHDGEAPQWFKTGVVAALMAPTALNRQAFTVEGRGREVALSYKPGPFSGVDLGLVKYHFELGAGAENYDWKK